MTDVRLLFSTRTIRLFAYGFLSVALALYRRHFGALVLTGLVATDLLRAASIARAMFSRVIAGGGYSIGRLPVMYSFWTSMTISARRISDIQVSYCIMAHRLRSSKTRFNG